MKMNQVIRTIGDRYHNDKTRLMDMLWDVQRHSGCIADEAVFSLAEQLNLSPMDVRETVTFYHFFLSQPAGKHRIYLADTVIAKLTVYDQVHAALEQETGCIFGEVDESGMFSLQHTNCIGLSDQEPAMMVDDVVFVNLDTSRVRQIIAGLKQGRSAAELVNPAEISHTDVAYIDAQVATNVHLAGSVFFKAERDCRALLASCLESLPEEIIETVTLSGIRGRGGAGFPTGLKWRLGREADGEQKVVICNADEGEPGTFKDRVLLTRSPRDVLLGMVIAAYAIGADEGIIYLRAEYEYLRQFLEHEIKAFREQGLLGKRILGKAFHFDIRIQMGAGAYVCGDETALIESCEGKRGTPRVKPPYPIQQGYLGRPTSVNNVETFAAVSRIIEEGGEWFSNMGTDASTGTRLLSVSGDCDSPGIYEIEWGVTLNEVLEMVGAKEPMAVQVSGPSGECVSVEADGERVFCYDDLSCNGSLMIFDSSRDLLEIVRDFMSFFVDESCGICVPCRAGNVDLLQMVERVIGGRATQKDLDDVVNWGTLVRGTSRCGLGTTSPKPILTTLEKFPHIYQQKLVQAKGPLLPSFDLKAALEGYERAHLNLAEAEK